METSKRIDLGEGTTYEINRFDYYGYTVLTLHWIDANDSTNDHYKTTVTCYGRPALLDIHKTYKTREQAIRGHFNAAEHVRYLVDKYAD